MLTYLQTCGSLAAKFITFRYDSAFWGMFFLCLQVCDDCVDSIETLAWVDDLRSFRLEVVEAQSHRQNHSWILLLPHF